MLTELMDMGFDRTVVQNALERSNYDKESALNFILNNTESISTAVVPYGPMPNPATTGIKSDDDEINKAIAMSLQDSTAAAAVQEKNERVPGLPVGLRSTGNLGFFNSLLQIYNSIPSLKRVLEEQKIQSQVEESDPRRKMFVKLITELRQLFYLLESGPCRYEDPFGVFTALSEIEGGQLGSSEKSHVSDFSTKFISRIEEALRLVNLPEGEEVPVRKDSVSFLTEEAILSGLFFGRLTQIVRAKDTDGTKIRKETQRVLFGKIDIEADDRDLYEAWDSAFKKQIEGFQVANGSVKASQRTWIEVLPGVLMFEINRLALDAQGNTIKLKKPFAFPKVLYPGRFLLKNQKNSSKLQRSMVEKKRRVRQLEESIEQFLKFNNTELNLVRMLNLCTNLLQSQSSDEPGLEESDIRIFTPSALKAPGNMLEATSLVAEYAARVSDIVKNMEEELERCTQEIDSTFDTEEMKEHVYELRGIIVHDGEVGSGQYYSYVHDKGIWRKFLDMHVSECNEKQVMFDSLGEYGISAACCLVYTAQNI